MKRLFSVYGDSISTYEGVTPDGWSIFYTDEQREATGVQTPADTWWMQVINHFDGELLANAAWSGCVCEGNVFPQGASERRIAALERDGKAPDDILIYIGINDYGWGSAYAQICGGSPNAPAELVASCPDKGNVAGLAPDDAVEKFASSYRSMLRTMHEKWPKAHIWAATLLPGRVKGAVRSTSPRWFRGICVDEYNKAIHSAATDEPSCTPVDAAALGFDYEAIDGTHPTKRGMRQLAAMYIRGMEAADEALPRTPYEGSKLLTDDMRTVEFCTKPCVGCEYAKGTGNNWWHVCEKQLR
ncbi:SGNH/GDSL hydrolase family protein [Ellagibacter isourolithinifaciens]|uniref:SGNH/GDSL hydrolase family protein n=1 Tax=Ellagibacter isourolithinifaciens TaxID=2137581 RepID=UPI003A9424E3